MGRVGSYTWKITNTLNDIRIKHRPLMNKSIDLPFHFPWLQIWSAGIVSVLVSLFAASVPLKRIARMDSIQAIRTEE
jgi:ABC-type antimicrobial peptide transport system permease subunit